MDTNSCKIQGYHACFPSTKTGIDILPCFPPQDYSSRTMHGERLALQTPHAALAALQPSNGDRAPMMFFQTYQNIFCPVAVMFTSIH